MSPDRPLEAGRPQSGGRRRLASTRRRGLDSTSVLAGGLLLTAVLAVVATGQPTLSQAPTGGPGALVDRATAACLAAPEGARGDAVAGLAAVPDLVPGGGWRTGTPLPDTDAAPPDRGALVSLDSGGDAVVATGAAAPGLFAHRVDSDGRALAVGGCVAPRARWWFAGAGAGLDHESVLSLVNVEAGPVVLDVRVLADGGEVETVGTRGITLGPGESRDIALTDIAPQNDEVVVAVEASRGRVAAAVTDRVTTGSGTTSGLEWLPAAEEPARTVRLAGVPERARTRTLVVGNPSEVGALVDVEVSGSGGTFTPVGTRTLTVPPGGALAVDASELVVSGEVSSLVVRASVPVVAALRSQTRQDHAYAGTVVPLEGPAVAPVVGGAAARLQLAAGAGGASVQVTVHDVDGEVLEESTEEVAARTTTSLRLPRRAAYVLVLPRSGNVVGAVAYDGPAGTATAPLETAPTRVSLPVVVPGPR